MLVSLSSRFKGLFLYIGGVLFHVDWYIRQLWCPSIISYNINSIAYDHHTDIYSQTNIFTSYVEPVQDVAMCLSVGSSSSGEKFFDYALAPGRWTHIAITYKSSTTAASLFADGEYIDTVRESIIIDV